MKFKDAVKYLRSELGLTQVELAMGLNVNAITVGRWENGKTVPPRSYTALLLEFARTNGASKECIEILTRSINDAAKKKIQCSIANDAGTTAATGLSGTTAATGLSGTATTPDSVAELFSERKNPPEERTTTTWLEAIFKDIHAGVSVVVYDDNKNVQLAYANNQYYKLFGYTEEQFFKELNNFREVIYPEDYDVATEAVNKVKETKHGATFRYRIIKRDKSIAHVRCSSSVISLEGVSDNVLVSILSDITESVQFEQESIASSQRLDVIMKKMNSAVTASFPEKNGKTKFLFCNELFYELIGYTEKQYQAEVSDPYKLVHPDDVEAVRETILSLQSEGETKELEYRYITRDGKTKWLRVRFTLMKFPDVEEPILLSVLLDITDIAEAKERLAAQNKQITNLLNDTPSGLAIVEVDLKDMPGTLRTVYYNDRFYKYSGYSKEEYEKLLKKNEMAFVFEEDIPSLLRDTEIICRGEIGNDRDTLIRCHKKDGGYRWLLMTGQLVEKRDDICTIYIAMVDVTERQDALERQRISDEMFRIAIETDKRAMIVYDIKNNVCRVESRSLYSAKHGDTIENVPQSIVERGIVSQDSADELCTMFERIRAGEKEMRVSLRMQSDVDKYEWFECKTSTIFDDEGKPDHAVLVFHNITEQRIKEAVFKKWKRSLDERDPETYTLFRTNLTKDINIDQPKGNLLKLIIPPEIESFDEKTRIYAEENVYSDDQEAYVKFLNTDILLSRYYRGEHIVNLDYREPNGAGEILWRRITVEMVEYPNSTDIQAFLLYEDINDEKQTELETRELAETDPLTGALNRVAFVKKVEENIKQNPQAHYAMVMLDLDGFKMLNDTFGHAAGDQALQEVVTVLHSFARSDDLVCRLGGDEFVVWLRDVPYDAVISKIAERMCKNIRKAYSKKVLLSASSGIAVYPRDGHSFEELYHNADKALYKVKKSAKGTHSFFSKSEEEETEEITEAMSRIEQKLQAVQGTKRRMLIVDDSETNRAMLRGVFENEYIIETAKNGAEALIRLRHFGVSISVVLLDLMMPDIDGFAVLRKMQEDVNLCTIPVVVVTGDQERDTLLKAFELGASEFVTKPIDIDIIKMRVKSVITKAENERLRAQNSYLMLQQDEEVKYRTVLESIGTVVTEYDWRNHIFFYDGEISKYIAGNYDHRGLWQIFLSDMIADSNDVKTMQDSLIKLAANREADNVSKLVKLKTPKGDKHWFRMNIYKKVDGIGLTERLIITFNDVHEEVITNEKLLFQATRDALTGLYNRMGFLEKATELIAAEQPGYYMMACIDVEKFKIINDHYGTDKGDEVLRHIGQTVDKFVRNYNGVCCRYSSDKFAILYPASLQNTIELAENHKAVANPSCIPQTLKLRIGRCLVDDISLPVSAIFDRATMAESLVRGRYDSYVVQYDESMRDNILVEQQIVGNMVEALANGEFEPWLQPQYNHSTGALIGAEALVRWRRNGEIIPPNDFIPVFERNGFIYEVDQSIWRQVCALLRRWLDEGKNPLPISVNISRYDLFQKNFIDVITGLVVEYQLSTELLRLEITESAFSADTSIITDIVGKLIDIGFTVEIDDFGSGYSSLNTLKDVPASILKLDMRFFEATKNSSRGGNIVESVVRMAKWLDMAIIAEGVENKEQADYLVSIGCFYIQGYYYSKPLPVAEYEKRMVESPTEDKLSHLEMLETFDAEKFWDPKSMETLIFNSYVGGACIFEFHNDKFEILRYNKQFINELHGLIEKDTIQKHFDIIPFLDSKSEKELRRTLQEAINSNKEASSELRLTKGEQKEYILQTSRVIAKTGDRTMYYCVIQNLTEQRATEEQLRVVIANINSGVSVTYIHGDELQFAFSNDKYYELLGYTQEQIDAELDSIFDIIHSDDRERVQKIFYESVQAEKPYTMEYRIIRRDGSIRYILCNANIVHLYGVKEAMQLSVYNDITLLREAQMKEQNLDLQMKAIMENIDGGISAITFLDDNHIDNIFANNGYYELLGYTREQFEAEVSNVIDIILPEDRENTLTVFNRIVCERKGETCEFRCFKRDGSIVWVKTTNTVISLDGVGDTVLLAITMDITAEKYLSEQIRFLNESASEILAQPNSEEGILKTLENILSYFAGERAYIFEWNNEEDVTDNTYEVCADGINPEIENFQGISFEAYATWFDSFIDSGSYIIPDVASMDDSETDLREMLLSHDIRSLIVVPLWRDKEMIGFLGVDNPTEAVEQVEQLIALADYIAVLLTRRDLMKIVEREQATTQNFLENLPIGAALYEFDGEKVTPIHINKRYWEMVDRNAISDEEISRFGGFHPEDKALVIEELKSSIRQKRNASCVARLLCGDGSYKPFNVISNNIREENGKYLLYVSFNRISDEEMAMQKMLPVALSTIISNTEDMSYVKDRELRYICVSQSIAEMAGAESPRDLIGKTAEEVFDPIFAEKFDEADRHVLETAKTVEYALEHIPTSDGSVRVAKTTKFPILDSSGMAIGIYCVSHDISAQKERESLLELLTDTIPGGLSAYSVTEDGIRNLYYNDGFFEYSGYTREEYKALIANDPLALIIEEDRLNVRSMLRDFVSKKEAKKTGECTFRCRTKNGEIRWMSLRFALSQVDNDTYVLNGVQLDITERINMEKRQAEMLDNLPFGAAMYEYDGKSLKVIHINKKYNMLVNREINYDLNDSNPVEAIHPEDRKLIFDEIRSAISQGRNGACDIRVLYGKDEYRFFHLDANINSRGNGKYVLYVAYVVITDKELELKTATEQLRLLSDSIPGGIATFRCMPGNIETIYYNDGVCDLTGYSREEFENSEISILSLIFEEDKPIVKKQINLLINGETNLNYSVRIHTKDGGYKWVQCVASETGKESKDVFIISAVLTDVTEQQEEKENLRVNEELNRLAIDQSGKIISRYDVKTRTLTLPHSVPEYFNVPKVLNNVPEEQIELGRISPETANKYREAYNDINRGKPSGELIYQQNSSLGWRWLRALYTTVLGDDGKAVSAVISFEDITEQREKEALYSRWKNAFAGRDEKTYAIVRFNLTQNIMQQQWEGSLLNLSYEAPDQSYSARAKEYVIKHVYEDDRESVGIFASRETLLAEYHRGHNNIVIEYRELNDDEIRWIRLTVDLVQYPNSLDVEAYLLFEDINEQKQEEIETIKRAETDPLTGILNRATFAQRVDQAIKNYGPQAQHALLMLDIDEFKKVNDTFGHGAGDQILTDMADDLVNICRNDDLVGRLGGDEFFIFFCNIGDKTTVEKRAQQICNMARKSLSVEVHVSTSIGIAMYPQDGNSFEELYNVADEVLYCTKNAGKDGYSFKSTKPVINVSSKWSGNFSDTQNSKKEKKNARRILIVDDNKISLATLENILKDNYSIEKASDGKSALEIIMHYGTSISAVLLDLSMPGMDGFEVLDIIKKDERLCTIPVIIVSADEKKETALRVIRAGASDLIVKPVDADLLRIRVESAVSKAENEILRAQNSYLSIRNTEVNSFRAALERTGTMVIMLDGNRNEFSYSPIVSQRLAGQYDERPLWDILDSDKVTDKKTLQKMQRLVQDIIDDQELTEGSLKVRLQIKSGKFKEFEMNVFKEPDYYGLKSKLIITLRDVRA